MNFQIGMKYVYISYLDLFYVRLFIQISLLLSSLPHVKSINLSFNPFPSDLHILPVELQWPNLNTLCLNGSRIGLEMIVELLKKTAKLVLFCFSSISDEYI